MRIAVTGAFGYSGRYIAQRLLAAGHEVLTLTNSLHRENPFGDRIQAAAFHFDRPELLRRSLEGVAALINTYWVRFDHRRFTHAQAVANTRVLFAAAQQAGVRRIVHISITHPDRHSDLPYFRGKAELEQTLMTSGLSYGILRPTVLFGKEDILINNIAWALRHLPVYGVYGKGDYRLQPIYVDDLAAAAVQEALAGENKIVQAIGPETFTYRELVEMIAHKLGLHRVIIGVPPALGYWSCRVLGWLVRDVIATREEIRGLMENRLVVEAPPLGQTKLTEWVEQHKASLGRCYTSEMARRRDRRARYRSN
ncbi:MAG TPA: NAD(P)H-binding protein [Verrucomicrobiota bacterium]|nr:NAD(P)H-binding protein [Verrucomicrobiota bacterium]HNT15450.1 NAD(P)H-binding protein [Verrucomicrobiota bacterium]